MTTERYHSSTMGYIPLSFTGRRLLANLRSAIVAWKSNKDWGPVSLARGEIAQYISDLEARKNVKDSNPDTVRVLRIVEYVGPRAWVESVVAQSVQGEKRLGVDKVIRAATIGTYPEILSPPVDKWENFNGEG